MLRSGSVTVSPKASPGFSVDGAAAGTLRQSGVAGESQRKGESEKRRQADAR